MKIVYIAGPYRSTTESGTHWNIRTAERFAARVWTMGAVALCPHKNSAYFGGLVSDEQFLRGCCALVQVCDAVLLIDGWETSAGACLEKRVAEGRGIPVFLSVDELIEFITPVAARCG